MWVLDADDPRDVLYSNEEAQLAILNMLLQIRDKKYVDMYNIIFWPPRFTELYPEYLEKLKLI